ncbi:MAG TPA: GspMb/PilO family protein [Gemmatimonadales bacterium]|nr:GspMb/PilO family protein [Gemmatimonadales bacterium]
MNPRDRRALIWGGAIVAFATLGLRVAPGAVRELRARRDALSAKQLLLARIHADLQGASALVDSAPAVERRLVALAPRLLDGPDESAATSDLTSRVTRAAGRSARIVGTAPEPDSARVGRLRRVGLRVSVASDAPGTLAMLARLGEGGVVLSVSGVAITAVDPASGPGTPEILRSDVTVRGWYLEGAPPSGEHQ